MFPYLIKELVAKNRVAILKYGAENFVLKNVYGDDIYNFNFINAQLLRDFLNHYNIGYVEGNTIILEATYPQLKSAYYTELQFLEDREKAADELYDEYYAPDDERRPKHR